MRSASAVLGVLQLSTLSGVAWAAPDAAGIAVRLELRGDAECVSHAELIARVKARSPRIRFVDDASAPELTLTVSKEASGNVLGELVLPEPDAGVPRKLVAASCADARDAVALIIAISLDPMASAEPRVEPSPTAENDAKKEAAQKDQTASARPGAPNEPKPPPSEANAVPAADRARAAHGRLGIAVAGQALFGPIPGALPGLAAYGTLGLDRASLWSPALVLGALHAWRSDLAERGGTAAFTLDAASLDACALRLEVGRFEGRACGSALVGRLAATGSDTRNPAGTVARPFAAAGAAALLSLRLSAWFELSARGAAGATLVRDAFLFTPVVFHTAAPVTLSASLGIGLRSP